MNNFELRVYNKIRDDSVVARVSTDVELQTECGAGISPTSNLGL